MDGTAGSENISNTSGNSDFPNLFLNSSLQPVFVWADDTITVQRDYFYTQWNGSAWVNINNDPGYTNISNNYSYNTNSVSPYLNSNDDLFVAYNLQVPGFVGLYFTRTGIPVNFYRTAQSTNINPGAERVTQATITAVTGISPPGADIVY